MNFPKMNQIGILVKDRPKAAAYYSQTLGIGPWFRSKTVKHESIYIDPPFLEEEL